MSGWDYLWRPLQVVGGVAEVAGGAVLAGVGVVGAPVSGGTSLAATVGGAAIGAHGVDQIIAGIFGTQSVASQLGGHAANAAGLPTWVGEIVGDIGPGFAGLASQIRNLPKLVANLSKATATGPALAKAVSLLRDKGALKAILSKLSPSKLKEMLKNKLITKDELREAGIDPDSLDVGAKASKSPLKALSLKGISPEDLELAGKAGKAPEQIAARKKIAAAFYRQELGKSRADAKSHMKGIDFDHPVTVGRTTEAQQGIQWNSHGQSGQYTTTPGNTAGDVGTGDLGVDMNGRITPKTPHEVQIPPDTPVMNSTAAPYYDTNSLGGKGPKNPDSIVVDPEGTGVFVGQHTHGGGNQTVHPPLPKKPE